MLKRLILTGMFFSMGSAAEIQKENNLTNSLSIETGMTRQFIEGDKENAQSLFMATYNLKQDLYGNDKTYYGAGYFEVAVGTLNGNRATNYLFTGFGYCYDFKKSDWSPGFLDGFWIRAAAEVGYNRHLSEKLSTHNMFSETVGIGWNRVYITYRHMSNGGSAFKNAGNNGGEDIYTIGLNVLEF